MNQISIESVIEHYKLVPHIEGGFYFRTYNSNIKIPNDALPQRFNGDRVLSSTILYLVPAKVVSKLHRLKSDEVWHFYLGDPFVLTEFRENGQVVHTKMGHNLMNECTVQHTVLHGSWFGGHVLPESNYNFSLLGCTIFPGFTNYDFELAEKDFLFKQFPNHHETISNFF